jgi:hypothetical protein
MGYLNLEAQELELGPELLRESWIILVGSTAKKKNSLNLEWSGCVSV